MKTPQKIIGMQSINEKTRDDIKTWSLKWSDSIQLSAVQIPCGDHYSVGEKTMQDFKCYEITTQRLIDMNTGHLLDETFDEGVKKYDFRSGWSWERLKKPLDIEEFKKNFF